MILASHVGSTAKPSVCGDMRHVYTKESLLNHDSLELGVSPTPGLTHTPWENLFLNGCTALMCTQSASSMPTFLNETMSHHRAEWMNGPLPQCQGPLPQLVASMQSGLPTWKNGIRYLVESPGWRCDCARLQPTALVSCSHVEVRSRHMLLA